jgi:hypothetical protein
MVSRSKNTVKLHFQLHFPPLKIYSSTCDIWNHGFWFGGEDEKTGLAINTGKVVDLAEHYAEHSSYGDFRAVTSKALSLEERLS